MSRPRLLLVDDHQLLLEGLRKILEPEFEIAGTLGSGHALVATAAELHPDAILLDISMPLLNGFDAARQLVQSGATAKLIFLSMHEDPDYVREAFRVGASGYLLKRAAADELLHALRCVLQNDIYVTPLIKVEGLTTQRCTDQRPGELTVRQRQVLQLIAEGHAGKAIASLLNVSPKTIEYHKAAIMRQLGVRTTAELTRYALKRGLIIAE